MSDSSSEHNNATDAPEPARDTELPEQARDGRGLTVFQQNLLHILLQKGGGDYGLGIKRALESAAYYDDNVNHGRLYPNLDRLVEHDYVAKTALDKRTNEYALTEKGLGVIRARLQRTHDEAGVPADVTERALAHVSLDEDDGGEGR